MPLRVDIAGSRRGREGNIKVQLRCNVTIRSVAPSADNWSPVMGHLGQGSWATLLTISVLSGPVSSA